MQNATLWRGLLGVEKTVVEGVEFDEELLVARVRPCKRVRGPVRAVWAPFAGL